ncbi:MAG: hypothetical protein JJT81_15955 [Rubellimicrobium sp.]|nr:hypothetical protein [Rubellimicrobium sp.]
MLYVDLPTQPEIRRLVAERHEASVSLYVATTPETQNIGAARTRLGQLLKEAEGQLEAAGTAKRTIWPVSEQVNDLIDDDEFWRLQANGLAVLVTPEGLRSYRLPTHLTDMVQVSDRFHLKPLLRAVSVPQHAFVLALEENRVRLVEVTGDLPPQLVRVPDMPKDAASAVGTSTVNSRNPSGRIQGSEGQNLRLRQFARKVDAALRPVLAGREEPLILAATDPLWSIFRSVNSYSHLADEGIRTSPATTSEHEIASAARPVLDALHAARLAEVTDLFMARRKEGRATSDMSDAARAATMGAVDTLLVDIDTVVPGTVDDTTGAITLATEESSTTYGVIDEIAGRTILAGGRVLGVRADEIPEGGKLAAILRYAV